MITKIVKQLKTGSIKNVIPFGSSQIMPAAPYIVVKAEAAEGVRNFRIFVHYPAGHILEIEDYIFNELSTLLNNFNDTDRNGNTVTVKDSGVHTEITTQNDDNTISMERTFFVPFRLH